MVIKSLTSSLSYNDTAQPSSWSANSPDTSPPSVRTQLHRRQFGNKSARSKNARAVVTYDVIRRVHGPWAVNDVVTTWRAAHVFISQRCRCVLCDARIAIRRSSVVRELTTTHAPTLMCPSVHALCCLASCSVAHVTLGGVVFGCVTAIQSHKHAELDVFVEAQRELYCTICPLREKSAA